MTDIKFPLEKILTVDAETYCKSVGKELSDYSLRGVHVSAGFKEELHEVFANAVPTDAEVAVDYKPLVRMTTNKICCYKEKYASGTALIPNKQ